MGTRDSKLDVGRWQLALLARAWVLAGAAVVLSGFAPPSLLPAFTPLATLGGLSEIPDGVESPCPLRDLSAAQDSGDSPVAIAARTGGAVPTTLFPPGIPERRSFHP